MNNNVSNNKRIAKNTVFLYIRMTFVLIVSLYTTRVVLNVLGVEDYGIYNVVSGFVSMFAFLNTSMTNGVQRFFNYNIGSGDIVSLNKVYNTAFIIQFLLAFLVLLLLETIGLWYLNNKMVIPDNRIVAARWIFQFSTISLLIVIMQIPYSAAIMAHEKMDYYAVVSIFDVLAKLAMALAIPYIYGDKLIWYGLFFLLVSIVNFFLYYMYSKRKFDEIKLVSIRDKKLFKSMLSFSGWNVFGTFAYMLKGQGLNVLLNVFFGPVVNAAQGVATMVSNAIQGFQTNIAVAFRPQVVQSYAAKNFGRVRNLFFSLSKISYLLLYTIAVPVIIEIEYVLHLWLGEAVPDYAASFTVLVLTNMVIGGLHTPLTQIVHATGKMKSFQISVAIIICSIVPVSWFFLKLGFSPNVVYLVSLVISLINQIVCLFIVRSLFPFSIRQYIIKVILPCFIITILLPTIPVLFLFIMESSLWRLVMVCFTTLICAFILIYGLALDKSEKDIVKNFIKRKQ